MKKTLHLLMLGLLVMMAGTTMAQTVTLDFDNDYQTLFPTIEGVSDNNGSTAGDFTETTTSVAVDGVTVTVTATETGTKNRIWTSAPRLRMYNGTFTVTAKDITKIEFTGHSTNFNLSTETGTLDGKTWTGQANEVVFAVAKNTQINKIVVTLGEGGSDTPDTPVEVKTVNVAEALAIIDGLEGGSITTEEYNVTGIVTVAEIGNSGISTQYGNATFTISDDASGSNTLVVFRAKGFNGTDITNENIVKVGDAVVVHGKLQKYVKGEDVTPEVAQGGYIVSVNGKTSDDTPVEVEKVADFKSFIAVENNKTVELTLNNAQVVYVNDYNGTKELFVRDAKGAVDLYDLGINATVGQILNGTIIGKRSSRSGFVYALVKADNTNASTVSVGAEQPVEPYVVGIDEAPAYYCDYVVLQSVTTDGKKAFDAERQELALYDRFKLNLLSDLDASTSYDIYGLMYDGGTTYGPELVVTKVTLAGGGEITEEPATPVASIEALLTMGDTENVELTLNNAKVLAVDGNNYIYMRENGKALCFYQINGLKDLVKDNYIVSGKLNADYQVYRLLPEVKSNKNTTLDNLAITESEEEAQPVETTLAEVATGKYVCDLVTLTATLKKDVTYKEDGSVQSTTYKLTDGNVELVVVNNSKNLNKIDEDTEVIVTGIVNTASDAYQIKLMKQAEATGISNVKNIDGTSADTSIFNLAGQRLLKAQKGINIVGGKKLLQK